MGTVNYQETVCDKCGKVNRQIAKGDSIDIPLPSGWAAIQISIWGNVDAKIRPKQENWLTVCPSCTTEVLGLLGVPRKRKPRKAKAKVEVAPPAEEEARTVYVPRPISPESTEDSEEDWRETLARAEVVLNNEMPD